MDCHPVRLAGVPAASRGDFPSSRRALDPRQLACATAPAVAVDRCASGRHARRPGVAAELAFDLARAGVVVVSGLARGVDSAAHRGRARCRRHHDGRAGHRYRRGVPGRAQRPSPTASSSGAAVVTEFPPGTPPRVAHFPRRNRIISGLSRAVVVVEAAEKSGALITARVAADQGRDVMAVPGRVRGRPQPRRARPAARRGKACGVCGRYSAGAGNPDRFHWPGLDPRNMLNSR